MVRSRVVVRGALLAVASLSMFACGGDTAEPGLDDAMVIKVEPCQGKCDGFGAVADLFEDMKDVDLDDLVSLAAPHATDALNDALSVTDYARIEIGETTLYGAREEVLGEVVVEDLGALSAGLTSRLGERDFAARVVEMRRSVATRESSMYAESRFIIGANLGHDFNMKGGDAVGRVGFDSSATIEAIAVSRFDDDARVDSLLRQPLEAARAARGFVLPRSIEDYRRLSPGESVAMRAEGGLGLNVGAGVPFLLASLGTALTVHARLSLAARASLEGKLDVQFVRGEGDELFVDVGMSGARIRSLEAALEPGFGVDAIPNVQVDLGVTRVGLGKLANDAIRSQLQKHIDVRASIGASDEEGRLRVARFVVDLGEASGADVEQALAQLVRGDMRLAQALSRQGERGVTQLIDMTKEYHHHDFKAGFNFLSMRFYIENGFDTGQITVDTEEGSQTLLFTELEDKRGFFFTDRESSWRTLVSIEQREGVDVRGQVNVRHIMREGQETFSRDEILDHTNSVLATLVTEDAMLVLADAVDAVGNAADDACRDPGQDASFGQRRTYRDCLLETPLSPSVQGMANQARAEIDRVIEFGAVRPGFGEGGAQGAELVRELVEFEITVASAGYDAGENVAPDGQVVSELRIAHDGVQQLMEPGGAERFMASLERALRVMSTRRTNEDLEDKRGDVDDDIEDNARRFGLVYEEFLKVSERFADLDRASALMFGGSRVGDHANLILVGEDRSLDLRTVAEHKGALLERFVPDIVDVANGSIFSGLGEPEIYVVGYALAGAVSPEHIEWVYSWTFDDDERLSFEPFNFYTRGSSELISAGVFDLDVLLGAKP